MRIDKEKDNCILQINYSDSELDGLVNFLENQKIAVYADDQSDVCVIY